MFQIITIRLDCLDEIKNSCESIINRSTISSPRINVNMDNTSDMYGYNSTPFAVRACNGGLSSERWRQLRWYIVFFIPVSVISNPAILPLSASIAIPRIYCPTSSSETTPFAVIAVFHSQSLPSGVLVFAICIPKVPIDRVLYL